MTPSDVAHRPPTAAVVLTGDELLRGFVQDANSGFLARELRDLGIDLRQVRMVADELDEIRAVLRELTSEGRHDLVVVTGGLGPTHDDRTTEAVADVAGLELELRDDALEIVEARVREYGRMRTPEEIATFDPGNRKQATLPVGAELFEPLGTAPGYAVRAAGSDTALVVLPGPPSELRHGWTAARDGEVVGAVRARVPAVHERLVRVWGVPESRAAQVLVESGHADSDSVRVTLCARDGELELSIRGADGTGVDALVDRLREAFPDDVFAVDDERPVAALVGEALAARNLTLVTAESCTGGQVGSAITAIPGSGSFFLGGIITYSNGAKMKQLHVPQLLIESHGVVSEAVARAMAEGAAGEYGADVAVSITGIAGPSGGSAEKPVGTVHFAVQTPWGARHRHVRIPGDRDTVRRRSTAIALHLVRQALAEADLQPGSPPTQ